MATKTVPDLSNSALHYHMPKQPNNYDDHTQAVYNTYALALQTCLATLTCEPHLVYPNAHLLAYVEVF